jgi:hypothetical protein
VKINQPIAVVKPYLSKITIVVKDKIVQLKDKK